MNAVDLERFKRRTGRPYIIRGLARMGEVSAYFFSWALGLREVVKQREEQVGPMS
jgi:hypothetical protein